jgi:RNA polymerase-binding transcription factor DksA
MVYVRSSAPTRLYREGIPETGLAYWAAVNLPPSFAHDAGTAAYYDQRAPDYDEWYENVKAGSERASDPVVDDSVVRLRLRAERASTLGRLYALTAEHDGIVAASADANADDEHDPEGSTVAFERAQVAALAAQAQAYLDDLDRAEARVDHGTYTACEQCGSSIAAARLAARPATRTCVGCAVLPPGQQPAPIPPQA